MPSSICNATQRILWQAVQFAGLLPGLVQRVMFVNLQRYPEAIESLTKLFNISHYKAWYNRWSPINCNEEAIESMTKQFKLKEITIKSGITEAMYSQLEANEDDHSYNRAVRYKQTTTKLGTAEVMHYLIWKDIRRRSPLTQSTAIQAGLPKSNGGSQPSAERVRSAKLWRRKKKIDPVFVLELVWNATLTAGSSKCFPMPRLMQLLCEMTLFDL